MARYEKGSSKEQDPNEIRKCNDCGQEKIVTEFVKGKGNLYRFKCKECRKKDRRTGKPNAGRFQTGHDKGVRFEKGHIPWYKLKGVPAPSKGKVNLENANRFSSFAYKEWRRQVFEKGQGKCENCQAQENLSAHHIKPWKDHESLRFDVNNGMILCASCHGKEEGFSEGHNNKLSEETKKKIGQAQIGKKLSEEHKKKISDAKLGKPGNMKGKKMTEQSKKLMRLAKLGKPCFNGFKKNHIPWNKVDKYEIKEE